MSFSNLKKTSKDTFAKIQKEIEEHNSSSYENDPDDWYPGVDKAGNGMAIIRFLPRVSEDDIEFVRWWNHNFQDPNTKKWYIQNSRTTLDPKNYNPGVDPVADFNHQLWISVPDGPEAANHPNRKQATRQMRKLNWRANIFVIEDSVNPENNGKVKKFKFGKWCWDKIEAVMYPKFESKKSINPFDFWEGANFVIEIKSETKGGKKQRNYSESHFESTIGPLATDKEMEKIYNQISGWSLRSYVAEDKFLPFAKLKEMLDATVGYDTAQWGKKKTESSKPIFREEAPPIKEENEPEVLMEKEEDDSDDFFAKLEDDADFLNNK